jgi:hypothetical protein
MAPSAALGVAPPAWPALGTTITASPAFPSTAAGQYCTPNYARVNGQICCRGLDPGEPLLDGRLACPVPGYGPVPAGVANVFLQKRPDGRVEIAGGPPLQVLSDPFRLPGDTAGKARDEAGKTAPAPKAKRPRAPGEPAPAEESMFGRYGGALMIAGAAIAAALLLMRQKAPGALTAPAAAPAAPAAPAAA